MSGARLPSRTRARSRSGSGRTRPPARSRTGAARSTLGSAAPPEERRPSAPIRCHEAARCCGSRSASSASACSVPSATGRRHRRRSARSRSASDHLQNRQSGVVDNDRLPVGVGPCPRVGGWRSCTSARLGSRAMAIGVITGSGTYSLPGFEVAEFEAIQTPFGGDRGLARRIRRPGHHPRLPPRCRATCGSPTRSPTAPTSGRCTNSGPPRWSAARPAGRSIPASSSARWWCSTTSTSPPTGCPTARCPRSSWSPAIRARPLDPARRPVLAGGARGAGGRRRRVRSLRP